MKLPFTRSFTRRLNLLPWGYDWVLQWESIMRDVASYYQNKEVLKGEPCFKILERYFIRRESLRVPHSGGPEEQASDPRGFSDWSRFFYKVPGSSIPCDLV